MAVSKKEQLPHQAQEIAGVAILFLALFLAVCLISYNAVDRTNWCGTVGHFTAFALVSFLGISTGWLVLFFLGLGVRCFSPALSLQRLPQMFLGASGVLLASAGFFGVTLPGETHIFGTVFPVDGYLGRLLAVFFTAYLGQVGSVLFFIALFLISIMAGLQLSFYRLSRQGAALTAGVWRYLLAQCRKTPSALSAAKKSSSPPAPVSESKSMPAIVPRLHEPSQVEVEEDDAEEFAPLPVTTGTFRLPSLNLLTKVDTSTSPVDKEHYFKISALLEEKLNDFGVVGKVVGISPGPVITTYEFAPAPGVKINKVVSLADDLALGLKAESVRVLGSIPGKAALGIEIPNPERQIVHIRDILSTEKFQQSAAKLTLGLGMDVVGNPVTANLAKMPHLLIAGATGAGKSVAINTIICSMLMKATPEEVRLLMIDPKRIELSVYEDIPHLLHPVVVDPRMASRALQWAVREMERRYGLMETLRVKNLASYNEVADDKLPLIVILIDELADLMMVSSKEVEDSVARLAQMARAAGMHLILATQRPSVDVLTGLIKANFPTRMSFKVSSKVDSRTILDGPGAEHLLGAGDMLFLPPGASRLQRIHGAYISEQEIENIVSFLKEQRTAQYDEAVLRIAEEAETGADSGDQEYDERYDEAVALVCESGQASISMIQRRLRVGYNRAARMIELMEQEGVVGPADGAKPREVLVRKSY